MNAPKRPVLRYHGGKWRLAPWVIEHFPPHSMYVEPFGGAASVLLQKPRIGAEVYNDLDGGVVNVFRVMRNAGQARQLAALLTLTPFSREEFLGAYDDADCPVEQARRTIIRAFMGQSANAATRRAKNGFRSKRAGCSGSPAVDWTSYPAQIPAFIERLRGVVIEHVDALDLIARYDGESTLFFVDPPYVTSTRTNGYTSYAHEMTDADHEALAERLHAVSGMVVLSGYDSPLYRRLYPNWPVFRRKVMADRAASRTECLYLSPRTSKVQRRSLCA
ncbi:MAG: DNA adenine [Desulfovibrionaceae bacterium]|nr:MAG: DNA adenine [Desulfovibrionaceae bacterium]